MKFTNVLFFLPILVTNKIKNTLTIRLLFHFLDLFSDFIGCG